MGSRRKELPIEDSWRVVDGENDSFDTSILPSLASDDSHSSGAPISSGQPSSGFPSQFSSQGNASLASQDSIRDFARHQEDEQNILLEPFRPSLPGARSSGRLDKHRTPDPQFRMPTMRIASGDRRGAVRKSPRGGYGDDDGLRRRGKTSTGSPIKRRGLRRRSDEDYDDDEDGRGTLADSLPSALVNILLWVLGVFSLAFRYIQRPLALLLAVYLFFGGIIVTQNMITRSVFASLSPICRVPGVSYLHLPFCPTFDPIVGDDSGVPIEFDDLMGVQSKFEEVLEKSAEGVSLPLEMKRSEMDVRDLRTLVKHSELPSKDELALEFDGYIDSVRVMAADLQRFNTHVGTAVDAVISINRWTSRYIDSLAPSSSEDQPSSALAEWASWFFFPFQPQDEAFSERVILDKYIEHTGLVSERIAALILEAQAVLRLLTKAEDHLSLIYDITTRTSASISSPRDDILWALWTVLQVNKPQVRSHKHQLALLKRVETQRSSAVTQISTLILELESIQAGLGDLRERVAGPQLLATIPLSVHIETIDRGVERLEEARARIRATESDKVREALARGGVKHENLIDGK